MERQRETSPEIESRSHRMQEQPFRRSEQNLATTLYQSSLTLPLAHQAACSEWRDVRRVSQLLVCDREFNPIRRFLADSAGKGHEYLSKSLPNRMAS